MPISTRTDSVKRRVYCTGYGILTSDEVNEHMDVLVRDPEFEGTFSQLVDFRDVTEVRLTHDEIFELAKRQVFSDTSKRAFVMANPMQFGLARMFQSYRAAKGERGIRIFTNAEDAVTWLDLEDRIQHPVQGPYVVG
jgi:hypothetical protein